MPTSCATPARSRRRPIAVRRAVILAALLIVGSSAAVAGPSRRAEAALTPPRSVNALARDAAAHVRWLPPDGVDPATIHRYRVESGAAFTPRLVAGTARDLVVGGLTNGTTYRFTVSAEFASGWSGRSVASNGVIPTRPNIVLVVTDDQRADSIAAMPFTNGVRWRRYVNMFTNEPQCCPSRASILSGRYSHHTGVETLDSGANFDESTSIAKGLRNAGYQTVFFGKYLNGYPFGRTLYVPVGWTHFSAYTFSSAYYDFRLATNGVLESVSNTYSTTYFTQRWVDQWRSRDRTRPFFSVIAYNAPHFFGPTAVPAPDKVGGCAGVDFRTPANFNSRDAVAEPAWMTGEVPKNELALRRARVKVCETLLTVDDDLRTVIREIEFAGLAENTYVVFTSDNGYSFGEHRLVGKGDLYDPSLRVPLLVRGPGIVTSATARLTSNVDLAPTIAEWARLAVPADRFDGRSFAGEARGLTGQVLPASVLLRGCRTQLIVETDGRTRSGPCGGYPSEMGMNWGVRTARYKYVRYPSGEEQLFDLTRDVIETRNRASDPAYFDVLVALRRELIRLRGF